MVRPVGIAKVAYAVMGTLLIIGGTAGTGQAAPLAPKKPSELVTLTTSGAQCGEDTLGKRLDLKQNPDGSMEPFSIPPGKVLVVTGFDWSQGTTGSANKAETMFLHSEIPGGGIFPMVTSHDDGSGDGRAGASVAVTGVAFSSGQTLCYSANTGHIGSVVAQVHGFLVKDN